MKCPNCGAESDGSSKFCAYCGSELPKEKSDIYITNNYYGNNNAANSTTVKCPKCGGSKIKYSREHVTTRSGGHGSEFQYRTVAVCQNCGHTWTTDNEKVPVTHTTKKAKNHGCLFWFGCLLIWPIALSVWFYKTDKIKLEKKIRIGIIIAFWVIMYVIGGSNSNKANSNTNKAETVAQITENNVTTAIPSLSSEETSSPIQTDEFGYQIINAGAHGMAVSGREEPNYVGLHGYAMVYGNEAYELKESADFDSVGWLVPVYEKDKQFYTQTRTIAHKTPVGVKSQELQHQGYGFYDGYLTVENLESHEDIILNVSNFTTVPYWNNPDIEIVAKNTLAVAEYNQTSNFYPITRGNDKEKVELPDGTNVLICGYSYTTGSGNTIEAKVFKEWQYGFGGVSVYFNKDDLKILR